jgi:hypothetical protein
MDAVKFMAIVNIPKHLIFILLHGTRNPFKLTSGLTSFKMIKTGSSFRKIDSLHASTVHSKTTRHITTTPQRIYGMMLQHKDSFSLYVLLLKTMA